MKKATGVGLLVVNHVSCFHLFVIQSIKDCYNITNRESIVGFKVWNVANHKTGLVKDLVVCIFLNKLRPRPHEDDCKRKR